LPISWLRKILRRDGRGFEVVFVALSGECNSYLVKVTRGDPEPLVLLAVMQKDWAGAMKCVARITDARGDWGDGVPEELLDCAKRWRDDQSESSGKKILDVFSVYLKAQFLPISIPELSVFLKEDTDIDAIEVLPFAFDFDEGDEPIVGAYAVFDIPFKSAFKPEMVQGWESEDGDGLAWCVSYFWEFGDRKVYLDVDYGDLTISPLD